MTNVSRNEWQMFQRWLDDSWNLFASKKEILESETAIPLTAGSSRSGHAHSRSCPGPGKGGPQDLGLCQQGETVTRVSPMLTGAPNRLGVDRHSQRQSKGER